MNSEISPVQGVSSHVHQPAAAEAHPARSSHPHPTAPLLREFTMRFTSSRHGARLARRLVSQRLDEWGYPYDGRANETLTLITAELAANAIRHGHVPGRDFLVRLTETAATLRVEVTDTRTERVPPLTAQELPDRAESGRGLLIVAHLATRWAVSPRVSGPGKTVWAELHLR
ncbi:ATP-binding protein [Streptomyces hygroscopicus]|uniref:ATP-binding protein n=1 Tax=Streptomyces hygroscopicus TaxID=1912 RepID=UPI00099EC286